MTIEDRLRAAMHDHDSEAPTRLPWPAATGVAPARRRPTARFIMAVAVIVVLVTGGTWLAVTWPDGPRKSAPPTAPTAPAAPQRCPTSWAIDVAGDSTHQVPARATVASAADRLVPEQTPASVMVCGYAHDPNGLPQPSTSGTPKLSSAADLAGDLAPVAGALAYLPPGGDDGPPCDAPSPNSGSADYLIGLRYSDGFVWVAAPGNTCSGAGNGAFTTSVNLAADASAWLTAGHWVAPPDPYAEDPMVASCPPIPGRLGQGTTMVPDMPLSLTICVVAGVIAVPHPVPADRLSEVVTALNALPARLIPAGTFRCGVEPSYELDFSYAVGPAIRVYVVPGCRPEAHFGGTITPGVDNGALQADGTAELFALVQQLTR